MMSKRRQALTIQVMGFIACAAVILYLFYPSSSNIRRLSDNWYDQTNLAEVDPYINKELGSMVSLLEQKNQEEEARKMRAQKLNANKVKAAFVILARNSDLNGVRYSLRQMEDRFNRKFNYPYVFLNEDYFTEEFKEKVRSLTQSEVHFGKIDSHMWGYPDHINTTYAAECRQNMQDRNIIYGGSESYRHMCRFQSGFFFRHPLLDQFEYYWRVEPDIQYFCDIDYDVFALMKENNFKYGWTLSLTEYMETIPSLWKTTQDFMDEYPDYVYKGKDSLFPWLSDTNSATYNGCHFWSNFEIGSLDFFRSERYIKFFEYLDAKGGFFYERWGDAPVHSIAVAMMLKPSEVHFFNDIGYKHNPLMHCPSEPFLQKKCACNEGENFDWTDWSCMKRYQALKSDVVWNEKKFINMTSSFAISEA